MCISLVRHIGFPIHFISVARCCPLVLIEGITQMWQDVCHIWKYYIIKCYKIRVTFYIKWQVFGHFYENDTYCYSPYWYRLSSWDLTFGMEYKSYNLDYYLSLKVRALTFNMKPARVPAYITKWLGNYIWR